MEVADAFLEILRRPTIAGMIVGMVMLLGPVWIAFLLGIMIGWVWKPRWASLGNCKFDFSAPSSPCSALIPSKVLSFGAPPPPTFASCAPDSFVEQKQIAFPPPSSDDDISR